MQNREHRGSEDRNDSSSRESSRNASSRESTQRTEEMRGQSGRSSGNISDERMSSDRQESDRDRVVPEPRRHDEISGSRLSSADRGSNRNSEEESRLGRSESSENGRGRRS